MLPVRETINKVKVANLVKESGFPGSTLYRWAENDAIPGKGVSYEIRRQRFETAARKLLEKQKGEVA